MNTVTSMTTQCYVAATKFIFGAFAIPTNLQLQAIQHIDSSVMQHAIATIATGHGKSGIYNISMAANALHSAQHQRTLVISPHNALLAQHCQQASEYLQRLPVEITSIESSDISEDVSVSPQLNGAHLIFVSIAAFEKLRKHHNAMLQQWHIKRIIIDEYHNIISEMFRFKTWDSLRNLAALRIKILCMSATANDFIMMCARRLMRLGDHVQLIGDSATYPAPTVVITVIEIQYTQLHSEVVRQVCYDIDQETTTSYCSHVIALSVDGCTQMSLMLQQKGISSRALHSDCTPEERSQIMSMWSAGNIKVLVSTLQDGIDCPDCKRVYIAGGSHSVVGLAQSVGRIRPRQQNVNNTDGVDAMVKIFDVDHPHIDRDHDADIDLLMASIEGADLLDDGVDLDWVRTQVTNLFSRKGYKELIKSEKECLRRLMLLRLGIASDPCGMCSSCTCDNHVAESSRLAADQIAEDNAMKDRACGFIQSILERNTCPNCDEESCSGMECLQEEVLLASASNTISTGEWRKHRFCSYCFGPKSPDLKKAISMEVHHQGDEVDGRVVQKCTLLERLKRVMLFSQTDNDCNTTEYLQRAFVCDTAYYKFVAKQWEDLNDVKAAQQIEYLGL